jgi:hypothetical protein
MKYQISHVGLNAVTKSIIVSGQFFLCLLMVLLTAFFGWEFCFRYGLVYNEMGRYFDEENVVVYDEQAMPVYGMIFVFCLLTLIMMCGCTLKTVRGQKNNN